VLVTKQYLYESIAALLGGGSPSAGKKFEPRMIQAHLQQAINRKLKTEYLTVTLPSDETIPEGLVLACYNDIPVSQYKGVLSRAQLPAMPISLRRNLGVYFVGPATGGNTTPGVNDGYILIESVTNGTLKVVGTTETITGLGSGSTSIICNGFAGKYVDVVRGNIPIPQIDPGDGSQYCTKVLESNIISLSAALAPGEYLKIEAHKPTPDQTDITVESVIGTSVSISGVAVVVTGLTNGSTVISSSAFANKSVSIIRGSVTLPGIDPGGGGQYYTKVLSSPNITLSSALMTGDYIKIQTL
jgi:hypothetical protein